MAEQINQGLPHTQLEIPRVFWKNVVHVILFWNPCTFKVSILHPSLVQGKYQEKNPTNSVQALLITPP